MLVDLPVFRLGVGGFSRTQEHALQRIASDSGTALWKCGPFEGADAWLVNGGHVHMLDDGHMSIVAGQPGLRSIRVQMASAARPVAFAAPVPDAIDAKYTFDLDRPEAVAEILSLFEADLAPAMAQFWFAEMIVEHVSVLSGAFEARYGSHLLGVLDTRGDSAVLCGARRSHFQSCCLKQVRRADLSIPDHFVRTSVQNLLWRFVARTHWNVLPERYRQGLIHFRRPPRVDQRAIDLEHLTVMCELGRGPSTFGELRAHTGLEEDVLARALAALYYVGSITTDLRRATAYSTLEAPLSSDGYAQREAGEPTVPFGDHATA